MNVSHLNRQPGEKFHNWARRVQGEYIDIQTFSEWRGIHKHFYPNSINMVEAQSHMSSFGNDAKGITP